MLNKGVDGEEPAQISKDLPLEFSPKKEKKKTPQIEGG